MELLYQLALGGVLIAVTVMIHAIVLDMIMRYVGRVEPILRRAIGLLWKPVLSSTVVVTIFLAHILQIWLWALIYLWNDCAPLQDLPHSLYFATVTYTTLGYGDIILGSSCRMLSGVEAANGFLMFGWTAAFIFEIISRIYRQEAKSI